MTEQALEKQFVRILTGGFESVGVDRKRKCLGQVVRKGLHTAYAKGELNLEQLEYHIRKLASFRGSDERTRKFLQAVSEIPDIMFTGMEKTLLVIDTEGKETGAPEQEPEKITGEETVMETVRTEGAEDDFYDSDAEKFETALKTEDDGQ